MSRGRVLSCVALLLVVGASIALLQSEYRDGSFKFVRARCGFESSPSQHSDAYRADLHLLSSLGAASNLVTLTDARVSANDVVGNIRSYRALVVVTAGRGSPTRRSEDQPFIALRTTQPVSSLVIGGGRGGVGGDAPGVVPRTGSGSHAGGMVPEAAVVAGELSALEGPVRLMNAAAAVVERVLGRRLFPITLSTFDRGTGGGPYAIFDASAGLLLLDRQLVSSTWSPYDKPEVSYLTSQLADRVFRQVAALLPTRTGTGTWGTGIRTGGTSRDGQQQQQQQPGDVTVTIASATASPASAADDANDDNEIFVPSESTEPAAAAAAAAAATGGDTAEPEKAGRVNLAPRVAAAGTAVAEGVRIPDDDADDDLLLAMASTARKLLDSTEDVGMDGGDHSAAAEEEGRFQTFSSSSSPSSTSSGGAAAAALQVLAAAVAAALPAAFAAAPPPLWFCILCPSLLGLLAPVLINLALNQLAGALCSQLHLTDDACFDVLLGALGAGFVLSLASAVPIFFVCRLPQCAGENVTAALRGAWA